MTPAEPSSGAPPLGPGTLGPCTAIVGAGSNLGSREAFLLGGAALVDQVDLTVVTAISSPYLTEPVGPPQPKFLNCAYRVRTWLSPRALLRALLDVEALCGRRREVRWGPRTLDLDLLWAVDAQREDYPAWLADYDYLPRATPTAPTADADWPQLEVPHPRLRERPFALAPLLEVAPELLEELPEARGASAAVAKQRWSRVHRGEPGPDLGVIDRVEALDDADAVALALSPGIGPGPGEADPGALPSARSTGVLPPAEALRVSSPQELLTLPHRPALTLIEEASARGWRVLAFGPAGTEPMWESLVVSNSRCILRAPGKLL